MYLSKTKKSKCGYCSKEMLGNNLKQHCKEVVTLQGTRLQHCHGELWHRGVVVISSANTLNIESISKTENSTKSSIVTASSYQKPSADENGRKFDMILSKISKLNSKLSKKIKPRKQANEVPKSDEHSDKLIYRLNHCKTIADLCESFDNLSYISQEESLVCNICVIYPSQGGSHSPGYFTYNIKNDDTYKSTMVLLRDFRNLKTHVKCHFENEVHLKNDCVYRKKEIHKGKCERREHAVGMRIARFCYAVYLIGSFKRNFEQETLKSVLNGLDVGDINHISEF